MTATDPRTSDPDALLRDVQVEVAGVVMGVWADQLVAAAGVRAGECVLDLACGTGVVARAAVSATGTAGRVVAVDVDGAWADLTSAIDGVEAWEATAENTGVESESLDLVLCQQGLQYFPDPVAGLRESHRTLRPGGRAFFSVWAEFAENPFITGQLDALRPHLPPEVVSGFNRTNVDLLGGPDGLGALLTDAGFDDVEVETVRLDIALPSIDTFFPKLLVAIGSGPLFDSLAADEQRAVLDRLRQSVAIDGSTASARMATVVASGVRR